MEEQKVVLGRLLNLAVRDGDFAGKVPKSFGYNQRRLYALMMARLGRIQESWQFIKGLASKPIKIRLLDEVFDQYRCFVGEGREVDQLELMFELGMIEAARFFVIAGNSGDESRGCLEIYRRTHDRKDIKLAKKFLMRSDWLLPGFERIKVLLEIALETKHPDDIRSVRKYFAFYGDCFRLEDSLYYWQSWKRLTGDPKASLEIRKIRAKMRRRKEEKKRELERRRQTFSGLLEWYRESGDGNHLQSAVSMIFEQEDPERKAEMILAAINAIDALSRPEKS